MAYSRRVSYALSAVLLVMICAGTASSAQSSSEAKKPSLSLRVTPPLGFSPLRVRLVVDVRGGDDDYEEFYCPTVEWDWGDETTSESTFDCRPYEAGKSEIRRRFTVDHRFRRPGSIKVSFRLKRNDKALATASVTIQVQPGVGGND